MHQKRSMEEIQKQQVCTHLKASASASASSSSSSSAAADNIVFVSLCVCVSLLFAVRCGRQEASEKAVEKSQRQGA